MPKRTESARPLLDYAFACLVDQKANVSLAPYVQKTFQRIPKRNAQGLVITWINPATDKFYNRSSLTKDLTMPGPELHQTVSRSLVFQFQGSKKKEIFQMHCSIFVVTNIGEIVESSGRFGDQEAFSVSYADDQGKRHQRFFFPPELVQSGITSTEELEEFCEQQDWSIQEIRSVTYYTESGAAMENKAVKRLYDANVKPGDDRMEVIASPSKRGGATAPQQRQKSKPEPVTPKKQAREPASPAKDKGATSSKGKVKKEAKKGGSGCLFITIFIALCIVFMMAYFSATFDIKEEDFLANYDVLGLHPDTATLEQVKKQFHLLSRKYHPDKNPNCPECEAKYAAIAHAKSVITDRLKAQGAQEDAMNSESKPPRPPGEAPRARSRY